MKKIILISLGVIVLLIAGVGIYVSMMDWNQHKERLATQISAVIGKKVDFSGNLKVSYFPHPVISAQSVNIINPQTNDTLAKISQLETDVSLLSLLKGAPDIQTLYLVGAELWVTLDEEGHNNWLQRNTSEFEENSAFLMQTVNIVNSDLHFVDKKHDMQFDITAFTAEIKAETVNGPYRLDGNFMKGEERYGVAFNVDALSQLDDINMMFVVLHKGSDSYVRYDGSYNMNANTLKGFVKGDFQRTTDFINQATGKTLLSEIYNEPMQFSVDVDADNQKINLSHLSVAFSKFLTGSGEVDIINPTDDDERGTISIKYQMRDLDFRPIWAHLKAKFEQYGKDKNFKPNWAYDTDYDVSIVRMIVSDKPEGVFENVSIKGQIKDNSFSIDDFYAGCAGNVVLNITGNLTSQDGVPHCSANIVADGRNFRSMINSLGFNLDAPIQGAYQSGKITASLHMTPERWQIEELLSTLDKSNLKLSADATPLNNTYDISISADKVNLDNYIFAPAQDAPKDLETVLKHDLSGLAQLQNKNIHLQAEIGDATFRGMPMKNLQLDAQYDNGRLTVTKAAAEDIQTSTIDIAAVVPDVKVSEPKIESLTFNVQSRDLAPLIKKFDVPLPEWPLFTQKNIVLDGNLDGDFNKINLNLKTLFDGDSFDYAGKLQNADGKIIYDGDFVVKTTRLEQLLNKININGADKSYRGVLNGKAHISGRDENFVLEQAEFKIGSSQYTGSLTVKKEKKIRSIKGEINATDLNWGQIIRTQKEKNAVLPQSSTGDTFIAKPNFSKELFDFTPYNNLETDINLSAQRSTYQDFSVDSLKFRIIGTNGVILLQNIAGKSGDADFSGNIKIEYAQALKMSGTILWNKIKFNNFGGSTYALASGDTRLNLDFETSAQSVDSIFASLSGTAKIKVTGLSVKGIDLAKIKEDLQSRQHSKGLFQMVQKNLQSGSTAFNPIDADVLLKNGIVSLDGIALKNDYTDATLNGNINLRDWRLNTTIGIKYPQLTDTPAFSFDMTGAINKPIMDISIGDIARKYDAYWDSVAQKEQEEKDKIKQEINNHVDQLKRQITGLIGRIDILANSADKYAQKQVISETVFKYGAKKSRMDEMRQYLQKFTGDLNNPNISNEDIVQIERQIQILRQEIDIMNEEIKTFLADDTNLRLENTYSGIKQENDNCAQNIEQLDAVIAANTEKLDKMNAKQYLSDSEALNKERKVAVSGINIARGIYNTFTEQYEKVKAMPNSLEKTDAVLALDAYYTQLKQQCTVVAQARQAAEDVMSGILKERQAVYDREQLAAEKKRQAEAAEDEGNLLAENKEPETPVVAVPMQSDVLKEPVAAPLSETATEVTANPVIETQPTQTDAAQPALQPIADDASRTKAPSGKIIRLYETKSQPQEAPKPASGLLRPVDGAVQKPSGTIVIK